ncbi:2OG-Fe dioxygenase family protein [Streptomyces caniferus]|uniref:2OG-Fe dioxygenase family protein n=1 Tax=Streptomyces caniferus TaxID=285557 RepID=UPI002E2B24D6|nr:2OG-Fe dioxygenase family protein [Streptomyces caniferus]
MNTITSASSPTSTSPAPAALAPAVHALTEPGGYLMPAPELSALLGVGPADWARFGAHWDALTLDTHMADGGTYRFRRYGQFEVDASTDALTRLPHAPYLQESTINPLNGGVERHFDPLTDEFAADPLLRSLLLAMATLFTAVDGTAAWNIKLHPYRITAGDDQTGQPAPEGRHRDGVTFITSLMINRVNVEGGESAVFTDSGEELLTTTLTSPGDLLLGDDRRTLHSVTPLHPVDTTAPAHRDVLVVAFTAR